MPPYHHEVEKSNELVTIVLEAKHRSPKVWPSKNAFIEPSQFDNVKYRDVETPKCNITTSSHFQECPKVRSLMDELLSEICTKAKKGSSLPSLRCHEPSRNKSSRETSMKWQYKDIRQLREEKKRLEKLIAEEGNELVKYLKRKNYLLMKREVHFNIITACIQAMSPKTREDTKMKFSLSPKGETGFSQWLDAMKMVAQLPGGMPPEFRTKLWLQLSEKHLNDQNVDWEKAEAVIFNESTNPDDEELGVQIVKDLHRTGCSLFCGEQEHNQALLKRVLLAYARWNKTVGYCQGFNMLAALILQVMEKKEKDAVKVMIYLIEGLLPESYFANNLRGLSVDMAVFRDLLRLRLPKLSKHLEALQNDTNAVNVYEPPLTNVFTMQWFLTLFSNCLPQLTVLRVWDLVFLYGNEILLRTALAIWEVLQDRIITVESADEFYSIMGVVTREMLEFGLMDANALVKKIAMVDPFPNELHELREKYLYNISPWTQSVQSAARKGIKLFYSDQDDQEDTEDDEKIAVATAYGVLRRRESTGKELQLSGSTLDLNVLKQQYIKLRERQRQAHVIITAACSSSIPRNISTPSVSVNHLLLGKSALVNKGRRIGPPEGSIPPPAVLKKVMLLENTRQVKQLKAAKPEPKVANQNKGNKIFNDQSKYRKTEKTEEVNIPVNTHQKSKGITLMEKSEKSLKDTKNNWNSFTSDSSSTSTELCDEESNDLEDASDCEVSSSGKHFGSSPTSVPVHALPDSPVPVAGASKNTGCDKDNFSNAKALAVQLVNEIEDTIKSSPKFQDEGNRFERSRKIDAFDQKKQNNQNNQLDNTVDVVSSLDVVENQVVPDNFLKSEPEVPITKNVITNFNVVEALEEEEEEAQAEAESEEKQKEMKKSRLGLSIMRENEDILHKFCHAKEKKEKEIKSESKSEGNVGDSPDSEGARGEEKKKGKMELEEEFKNLFQFSEKEFSEKSNKPEMVESFLPPQSDLVEKAISPIVLDDFAIPKAEKVNKEVNTEITFGAEEVEISASKAKTCLNGESKPATSDEVPGREEIQLGEKPKKYSQKFYADFVQKDEIKTKIEVSKSDWELKMKKIAELEATARETLNEMQGRSSYGKSLHRSLDRNTKRTFFDAVPEREASPSRPSTLVAVDKNPEREGKVFSSSFDEITSRTEKLLGYSDSKHLVCDSKALDFDKNYKDCVPRFKGENSESFDNRLEFSGTSHFKSSPTSPERRVRGTFLSQSGTKIHTTSFAEVPLSTYSNSDYGWTKHKNTDSSHELDTDEYFRGQGKAERDSGSYSKKSVYNPFPTKNLSRSRELNAKLGLYPTSPENR